MNCPERAAGIHPLRGHFTAYAPKGPTIRHNWAQPTLTAPLSELQSAMKTSHKTADISRSKITSKKRSGPGALSPSGSKAAKGLRKQRRLDEWKKSSVQPQVCATWNAVIFQL